LPLLIILAAVLLAVLIGDLLAKHEDGDDLP
jgi:hypothetical protein